MKLDDDSTDGGMLVGFAWAVAIQAAIIVAVGILLL